MDGCFPWPAFWAPPPLQEWGRGWPPEDSSGSPSSSPGSGSLSPSESPLCPAAAAAPRRSPPEPRVPWSPGPGAPKGGRGGRLGQGQRQSASQREKLRMRHLAKALHTLRRYLPPSVAPAGQSLTKIETLRLAIRYIGHLSELLGLGEEALAARRAAPLARRCCHRCPPGLGCCQPERPTQERQAGPVAEVCCWPSPPCGIRPPTFLDPCSPQGTGAPSRPRPLAASPVTAAPAEASWLSAAAYCSEGGNRAACCEAGGTGAEALLLPAEFADLGLSPQSLPGELVSFLEGLLPPASHE